jgi:branched-chain amino acid transport system ATP-binding protein
VRDEIWKTIRLIRETGMATLIVDKTVAAVTAIADRVVILVKGEVVFEAPPADLLAKPDLMHRTLGV